MSTAVADPGDALRAGGCTTLGIYKNASSLTPAGPAPWTPVMKYQIQTYLRGCVIFSRLRINRYIFILKFDSKSFEDVHKMYIDSF